MLTLLFAEVVQGRVGGSGEALQGVGAEIVEHVPPEERLVESVEGCYTPIA